MFLAGMKQEMVRIIREKLTRPAEAMELTGRKNRMSLNRRSQKKSCPRQAS